MLAKHFSTALGFSNHGLLRAVSSASLFLRCSTGLLAARGKELVQPPALGRCTGCFWKEGCAAERESWSSICRNGELRKSFFLTKTLILETNAEADNRP